MDVQKHLGLLYPDESSALQKRIDELLARHRRRLADAPPRERLSQRDVMLITYGDTLTEKDEPPLEVLHRFHRSHLAGLFDLVHVLPFHPYSSDDGFSVIDYYAVREDLGGWEDIERLAGDCGLMADAVINHVSSQSVWFRGYLDGSPEFAGFFVECDPAVDLSDVVRPRTSPLLTPYEDADGRERHIWTTFSADQVDLNYRNPDVLIAVLEVLLFLIARGARLLRLDAVTFLWKEPGTPSANMAQTHAIIKIIRAVISALHSDVVLITETNVPHRENVAYFGDGYDEAHAVYNFALPPLVAHSFIQGNSRRLTDWAGRLALPSKEVCFLNFSASHDGVGVRPVEEILDNTELSGLVAAAEAAGGMVSSRTTGDGKQKPYELNCTYIDLISRPDDTLDRTVRRFVASQAIVLAMPGIPAIYIHSLLGTRNDLARVKQTGRARSINRSQLTLSDVEAALADDDSLRSRVFSALADLIRARRDEPAFDPFADFDVLDLGPHVFALRRIAPADSHTVVSVVNLTDQPVTVEVSDDIAGRDLLNGRSIGPGREELAPFQVLWIRQPDRSRTGRT